MSSEDPIAGFGTAEHVASFLLQESFRYAHWAAEYEVSGIIFGEMIESITPDPNWKMPEIPKTISEWIEVRDDETETILDPETFQKMVNAWQEAQNEAIDSDKKLDNGRLLSSTTNVVGCVVNLTICLESVLNRHLYFLRESGQLPPELFRSIDRAELMPKLLFCFKEQILSKSIHISRIKKLISLRNKAVHYRVDEFSSLSLNIGELIGIWKELGEIFALTTGEPTKEDIQNFSNEFINKWIS